LYGTFFCSSVTSLALRPTKRLIENTVLVGLVIACRRATCPTRRSPSLVNATTDGVVRPPSAFGITTGSPPSMTATTELVVPRSIPMTFAMGTPDSGFVFSEISRGGPPPGQASRGIAPVKGNRCAIPRAGFGRDFRPNRRDGRD
jgi:hypothetical protein